MKLKSYFAESVDQALSRASKELGPEAMLVYSREAHPEARHLGSYEVVFAAPPSEAGGTIAGAQSGPVSSGTLAAEAASGGNTAEDTSVDRLSIELAVLRRQMDRMMTAFARGSSPTSAGPSHSGLMAALNPLLQAGVSDDLVEKVAYKLSEELEAFALPGGGDLSGIRALRRELGTLFSADASLGRLETGPKFVALVGPPGSGKTSTLVKLAVAYGLKSRKPVQLISMDTWRVGGADQLRSYAAILGVGFQALDTPGALAQALEEHRHKDLILIDTPGLSEKDLDVADGLASFLRSRSDVDTHLTLTASMKPADLTHAVDLYEGFRPAKLLFTKVDETGSLGTILNEAVRTAKPVSFLTSGQRIPEDLEEASKDRILDLILGSRLDGIETPEGESGWPAPVERRWERDRRAAAA